MLPVRNRRLPAVFRYFARFAVVKKRPPLRSGSKWNHDGTRPTTRHISASAWGQADLLALRPIVLILGCLCCPHNAVADDWPQWMGPGRDNVWRETDVLEKFPQGGPKILWSTPIAGGYAGPAVASGKVFVTDYVTGDDVKIPNFERNESTGQERVMCLDELTGKVMWMQTYPVSYSISYPAGPRCTPTVDGDRVYTLGAQGMLICFDAQSGNIRWQKDLVTLYGTKPALWGYAAHPLIDGNKLITLAGGNGSHVVAFDKLTGNEIWKTITASEQGYSPPTIIEASGIRQLILLRPDAVTSIHPETGAEYWSVPYEASSGSIIMSPIKVGDYLYAAGYSNKSILLKLGADEPTVDVVWRDRRKDAISPVNVQPFVIDDVIYGFDQSGVLRAVRLPEGQRLWETTEVLGTRAQGSETAFLVQNGQRFFLFNERGELVIARLTPDGYEEVDRAKVIEPTNVAFGRDVVWCMPAFANKHMYVRNDEQVICVDLQAQ